MTVIETLLVLILAVVAVMGWDVHNIRCDLVDDE
jgi:hypothetical protein